MHIQRYVGCGGVARLTLVVLILFTLTFGITPNVMAEESQYAWLRMGVSSTSPGMTVKYTSSDPDPWLSESWVVETESPSGNFEVTIDVTNIKKDRNVYDIVLVFVTNEGTSIDSMTVDSYSFPVPSSREPDDSHSMYTDAGPVCVTPCYLGEMPPHGIYNDPSALWREYRSGVDLAPEGSTSFTITFSLASASQNFRLHIDAYGWTEETSNSKKAVVNGDFADAVFVPFSKDITITVPEFGSSIPIVASTAGIILLLRRRLSAQGSLKA